MDLVVGTMFKELAGAAEGLRALLERCGPVTRSEAVHLAAARGRVLSEDLESPVNLPAFNRAAMDGYAVRAADTRGASPLAPVYLKVDDEAGEGRCVPVRTGMAAPPGADAVLMMEDSRPPGGGVGGDGGGPSLSEHRPGRRGRRLSG